MLCGYDVGLGVRMTALTVGRSFEAECGVHGGDEVGAALVPDLDGSLLTVVFQ